MERDESAVAYFPITPDKRSSRSRRSYDVHRPYSKTSTLVRTSDDLGDRPVRMDSYDSDRRRSGEQTWTAFANGVRSRLGSLSRKSSQIKATPTSVDEHRNKATPSPSPTFSRSRAASRSHSRRASLDLDSHEPQMFGTQIETIIEDDNQDEERRSLFPMAGDLEDGTAEMTEIERRPTPLLPRFNSEPDYFSRVQSPLQSPAIVPNATTFAAPLTPALTPTVRSPALSQHSSTSSIKYISYGKRMSDVRPVSPATQVDEWAAKLGHEDFVISPEPYMPSEATRASHEQLLHDWNKARFEFSKHRSQTESIFSATSTIYKLTEEKWATIDAQWKGNSDAVFAELCESGQTSYPSPREPAPVRELTDINDPRLVQTLDIVGPMSQDAPKLVSNPAKRESWFSSMRAKARGRRSLSNAPHPHRTATGLHW